MLESDADVLLPKFLEFGLENEWRRADNLRGN